MQSLAIKQFEQWTGRREVINLSTNAGSQDIPFQSWRHFKEAYTPELILRAVKDSPIKVKHCLDPFAGSGTTALACQFLGIEPTTIEVNPYLADLVEAKLATYNRSTLSKDFALLVRKANNPPKKVLEIFKYLPPTFIEPGINSRWIFDRKVAERIAAFIYALDSIKDKNNYRLFKVLLGGILINISNVFVSGKGRKYRNNWEKIKRNSYSVDEALCRAIEGAIYDIVKHNYRNTLNYNLLRGDSRLLTKQLKKTDLAIFSPPYPNSFDYTDVYNVELWVLGYIKNSDNNHQLRSSTLASHVQVKRQYSLPPKNSKILNKTTKELKHIRSELWNNSIPEMIGGYFSDMNEIICNISKCLPKNGQIWAIVGDSKYAGVTVPVASILTELAENAKCKVVHTEPFRSMRASPQQGGQPSLAETLVVLGRR